MPDLMRHLRFPQLAVLGLLALAGVVAVLWLATGAQAGVEKVYWTDGGNNKIQRANLDGSNVEDLITSGLTKPLGIALDVPGGKMYWVESGKTDAPQVPAKVKRANLDGSGAEDLIATGLSNPFGIALDVAGGKMYWTDDGSKKIQRADLDGSNVETLVNTGTGQPFTSDPLGLALDVAGGKMYWIDAGNDKIRRANLDGSNVEDLVTTGLLVPVGIALDVAGGKMYWTDEGDKIRRANLDGSNVEDLVTTGLTTPRGIVLDVAGGKMYWTDQGSGKIQRANLDGSNVEDLVPTGLGSPLFGIALVVPEPTPTASPTGAETSTPTTTPTPTLSPSSSGGPTPIILLGRWGDNNCDGEPNPIDSLITLRSDAALPVGSLAGCPDMKQPLSAIFTLPARGTAGAVQQQLWGDVDCGSSITPVDSLKLLRFDAGFAVVQPLGCPSIGASVQVEYGP